MSIYNLCLPDLILYMIFEEAEKRKYNDEDLVKLFGNPPYHFAKGTYKIIKDVDSISYNPVYKAFGRSKLSQKSRLNIYNKLESWIKKIIKEYNINEFGPWRDKLGLEYKKEYESNVFSVRIPIKLGDYERKNIDFPEPGDFITLKRGKNKLDINIAAINIATNRRACATIIVDDIDK